MEDVEGDRVLLAEDTWISGATALSAAGNLFPNLRAGEYSVCIDRRCVNGYLPPHGDAPAINSVASAAALEPEHDRNGDPPEFPVCDEGGPEGANHVRESPQIICGLTVVEVEAASRSPPAPTSLGNLFPP